MLTLQQLRILLAVESHGSLNRAADHLHIGVPTVVHHIDGLEAHFKAVLVDRQRSGARLTPMGLFVAGEARAVLEKVDSIEHLVGQRRDAGVVTLRLATFASFGARRLATALADMSRRSDLEVIVSEAEPTEAIRMVRSGEVHAGIVYDVTGDPSFAVPDVTFTPLIEEPLQVLLSSRSKWAAADVLDFATMSDVRWIFTRTGSESSDHAIRRACRAAGYEAREAMKVDDMNMIHSAVALELGMAVTTALSVDDRFDVLLKPAAQRLGVRRVYLATSARSTPVNAVAWLKQALAGIRTG